MLRFPSVLVSACLLAAPGPAAATPPEESDLSRGIRLVEQGENGQAIVLLDTVARRLRADPKRQEEAGQACFHLGLAYLGEGQEALAAASFREAVTRDPSLDPSAFDVSPKVREMVQRAREEVARGQLASPPPPRKGGHGKAVLLTLGAVGLAGAGAAAAVGSSASLSGVEWLPDGTIVQGVAVRFKVLDANCSSVVWDFGDGGTGSGTEATHAYLWEGGFTVKARCSSGSLDARTDVTVRSLTGTWDGLSADGARFVARLSHSGATITGDADGVPLTGSVGTDFCDSGRCVRLTPQCDEPWVQSLPGSVDGSVNTISGTAGLPCRTVIAQTLTRRP